MSPDQTSAAANALALHAGGYLFNTIVSQGVTCRYCRVPVSPPYETCVACHGLDSQGLMRADRRGYLTYAISTAQSATLMYGYKGAHGAEHHQAIIRMLLQVGFMGHASCPLRLGGGSSPRWAVVPSLRQRVGVHPLTSIVRQLIVPGFEIELAPGSVAGDARIFNPDHFSVVSPVPMDCHAVLIDDTWVGGGHAESAGLALRRAGATQVSILNVARMLNMSWGANPPFVRDVLRGPYVATVCPWTATGVCP